MFFVVSQHCTITMLTLQNFGSATIVYVVHVVTQLDSLLIFYADIV
jgi:hypothetical protein